MSTLPSAYANRELRVAITGTTARERRIEEAAEGHLRKSSYLALKDIGCTCREGVVTRGALASGLGEEVGGVEASSSFHMATQVAAVADGMLIAVPPPVWEQFVALTAAEFAGWLYDGARRIDWGPYRKSRRGVKKPVVVKRTHRGAHRSTARELNKAKKYNDLTNG